MSGYEFTIGKTLDLKAEQEKTFSTPQLKPNFALKVMFVSFDLIYGARRTLPKFLVLEILARYPYWAWETGSYRILSRLYCQSGQVPQEKVAELLRTISLGRESQDNEQDHLLMLADLIHQRGIALSWLKHFLIPRVMAWVYYHMSNILYALKPAWSFAMNAAFESHAERQYMLLAREHPEWDKEKVETVYFRSYPRQDTLAGLLRRIGLDERDHMNHSLAELDRLDPGLKEKLLRG